MEILTPVRIIAAGADRVVDTSATERFALRLKVGRCVTIPGARHQVFVERPSIDAQLWAAFDAFIPGETVSPIGEGVARDAFPATRIRDNRLSPA